MKFTTLIPLKFNDGVQIPEDQIDRIIDRLTEQFDGCSDEGITQVQRVSNGR
jgi:hypothetical protein